MTHVDQRTLDALLSHKLSSEQVSKVKQHVGSCRKCSRQLEEWRDLFVEVESIIPTYERPAMHPDPPVLVPSPGFRLRWRLDYTRLLLPAGVFIALVVIYLASHPGRPSRALNTVSLDPTPTPSASPIAATLPVGEPTSPPDPAPPRIEEPAIQPAVIRAVPPPGPPVARESPQPVAALSRRPPADSTSSAPASTAPHFSRVEMEHAVRMLAGSIRLIDGLEPDHVEAGPGETVPGARVGVEVVRVVYVVPGGRVLLDQQRLAVEGEPVVNDTLLGTGPDGVSLVRWADSRFWLVLAGRMSQDSLRQLMRRVR